VLMQYGETRCIQCGWYSHPPNALPPDNSLHRWESTLCERCHERHTIKGWPVCHACKVKWGKRAQPSEGRVKIKLSDVVKT
jgi:hypothetical protein